MRKYTFGQLQPDVIAQFLADFEGVAPYVENYELVKIDGVSYFLKKDSPYIRWDNVPEQ